MRARGKQVLVRLNEKEYAHLKQQADIAGMKTEPFIRASIMGIKLRPRPPDEYKALLREMSAIGNNVNQLAKIANMSGAVDPQVIAQLTKTQMVLWRKVKDL